jgi:hypothetical protein
MLKKGEGMVFNPFGPERKTKKGEAIFGPNKPSPLTFKSFNQAKLLAYQFFFNFFIFSSDK